MNVCQKFIINLAHATYSIYSIIYCYYKLLLNLGYIVDTDKGIPMGEKSDYSEAKVTNFMG